MKKIVLVLLMVTVLCFSAVARGDHALQPFLEGMNELLFETGNVTLKGGAEFFLDGERFKTGEILYVQDGGRSLYQLSLQTPVSGKEDKASGYTVIADGERVHVMEVIFPGVYRTGTTGEVRTILRKTVQEALMARVASLAAEALPEGKAVTVSERDGEGQTLHLEPGEDVPEVVNTSLNLLYQFLARRYFGMDYNYAQESDMVPMENYLTVTRAILCTTLSLSLKGADLKVEMDGEGRILSAEGDISLNLNTARDGRKVLDIRFRMTASDRGNSRVEPFDPETWGVVPAYVWPEEEYWGTSDADEGQN